MSQGQPHDALFKKTFSVVEHAAAELRAVLPKALVLLTDFSSLQLCSGSFVDEALAGSESDLLFTVSVAGKPAFCYLLFEHQSSPDRLMPLRLLRYVGRVLDRHVSDAATPASALPLPLVIPVVLYHGEAGWTVARRLEDLFDPDLLGQPGLEELAPRLSYVVDDISHLSDEDLEHRALGLVPVLTLWAFRDARNPERFRHALGHWATAMFELLRAPSGREALFTLIRYITLVADQSVADALTQTLGAQPQVKDALMTTIAEKWFAEAEARGEAKGKAEGKTEGKAETLRKLLTLKFGALPGSAVEAISSAGEAELDGWLERVLNADSLDAVFAH